MIKKIIKWSIYAALVGILIFGAVNRTSAKLAQEPLEELRYLTEGGGLLDGSAVSGQGGGGQGQGNSQEGRGQSENSPESGLYPRAEAEDHSWSRLTGTVIAVSGDALEVAVGGDAVITIEGQAWRLALENGFAPGIGDQLDLNGFYEGDEFEVGEIVNLTSGQAVALRDEAGRPLWSGGARRQPSS